MIRLAVHKLQLVEAVKFTEQTPLPSFLYFHPPSKTVLGDRF